MKYLKKNNKIKSLYLGFSVFTFIFGGLFLLLRKQKKYTFILLVFDLICFLIFIYSKSINPDLIICINLVVKMIFSTKTNLQYVNELIKNNWEFIDDPSQSNNFNNKRILIQQYSTINASIQLLTTFIIIITFLIQLMGYANIKSLLLNYPNLINESSISSIFILASSINIFIFYYSITFYSKYYENNIYYTNRMISTIFTSTVGMIIFVTTNSIIIFTILSTMLIYNFIIFNKSNQI